MKKIVFIINSIRQARCIRRVEEFTGHGYEVEVYGFDREGDNRSMPDFPVEVVGIFTNGANYLQRIRDIRNAIKDILETEYDKNNTIFYLFNLDVALAFRSIIKSGKYKYIYEVSDLTELVVSNMLIRKLLIWQNKRSMLKSLQVVFTSEGFCDYYSTIPREKISIIPNKVNERCPAFRISSRKLSLDKIKIGFVGIVRFETVYNFAKVCKDCTNIEFHLYGLVSKGDKYALMLEELAEKHNNIILHGAFKNPQDLPSIYESIDMVLSAYPPTPGVIYAEPNKLYEAIYFRCPIIVNNGTFLGRKVNILNVGYVIDAMNEENITTFVQSLNTVSYQEKVKACFAISQKECLNINDGFFQKLETLC